jgi:hypothetical protein
MLQILPIIHFEYIFVIKLQLKSILDNNILDYCFAFLLFICGDYFNCKYLKGFFI